MIRKLLFFKFAPENKDLGLLALRLIGATSIFLKHGIEKVFHYHETLLTITARHHYLSVLGAGPTFFWETVADGILTILLVIGFATRWCALLCFSTIAVAWSVVLQFAYFTDKPGANATHGEMTVAYMACLLALVFSGGGKYSIDALLDR